MDRRQSTSNRHCSRIERNRERDADMQLTCACVESGPDIFWRYCSVDQRLSSVLISPRHCTRHQTTRHLPCCAGHEGSTLIDRSLKINECNNNSVRCELIQCIHSQCTIVGAVGVGRWNSADGLNCRILNNSQEFHFECQGFIPSLLFILINI